MTISDWLKQAEHKLKVAGIHTARLDALVLAQHLFERDKSWLLAHSDDSINKANLSSLDIMLSRRLKREPLAYILGQKEFYGLDFSVTSDVLIPRPETEVIVETAIRLTPNQGRVLEVGTGSGAIAVALKLKRPDVELTASDISAKALKVAKHNARHHQVSMKFLRSNLFANVTGTFDMILANLPYVPLATRKQPELDYEPTIALYGGADGLDHYRRFFENLPRFLKKNSQVVIEAGPTQRAQLIILANQNKLKLRSISEYVAILK